MHSPNRSFLLTLLVFSQFAGTSLWFAGNIMVKGLVVDGNATGTVAQLSSLVQAGFITGTLLFAILTVADRFRSSVLFFTCSVLAAFTNIFILFSQDLTLVSILRFATGFFLAGIYPVGMKIAAEKFPDKLGNALGYLVGALVLGTSLPHLLDGFGDWKMVAIITSLLAFLGGLLVLIFIPSDVPKIKNVFNPRAIPVLFQSKNFKWAAFGYFGHMWELYAFWAFVPLIIEKFNQQQPAIDISQFSFIVIAIGGAGCVAGGLLSKMYGSKIIAMIALLVSLTSCLLIPFTLQNAFLFITLMVIWGFSVVADSPQFSTMVAQSAPAEYKGTALTIITCIGFAITIVSIQLLKLVFEDDIRMIWILVPGPLIGLWFTKKFNT